jgi:hypothetical protein
MHRSINTPILELGLLLICNFRLFSLDAGSPFSESSRAVSECRLRNFGLHPPVTGAG